MMIDITTLTQEDVGRWVIYRSSGGDKVEEGRLKSWNDTNMFVVYHCNNEWNRFQDFTGAATDPADLDWKS
jgi:hypothetical protein